MTKEELLQEFLEATKIPREDIAFCGMFTRIDNGGKIYEGIEGLCIELKPHSDSLDYYPSQITYFHHPTTVRLKQ